MGLNQSEDRFNGVIASLAIKAPCKTVTDGVGNILLEGEQTINSIAVVVDDRVLVMEQTDPVENGIYNVRTSTWARAADWDGNRDVVKGTLVTVNRPPNNLTSYVQVNLGVGQDEPTIDIDPVNFSIYFTQTSSLDDLDDVDLTGCADDDMMYFSGGVLICTLGVMTFDGASLTVLGNINGGPGSNIQTGIGGDGGYIAVRGFNNEAGALRAIRSTDNVASLNPRFDDPHSGIGGSFAALAFLLNNGSAGLRALRLNRPNTNHTTREWQTELIDASTTQTQGQANVQSTQVRVETVANDNDVITLLDPPVLGLDHVIINDGANTLQIFPASGDDLGQGTNNSMTVAAGGTAVFVGLDGNTWHLVVVTTGSGSVGVVRGAKVFHSADFTPNDNTVPTWSNGGPPTGSNLAESAVPFNSEVFDTDTIHDTVTFNSRLTTPAGISKVVLKAGITNDEADTGGSHMRFRLNGGFGSIDGVMPNYIPHSTMGSWGSNDANPDIANAGYLHDSGIIEVQNPGTDYYELYLLGQGNGVVFARANKFWFQMEIIE